MFLLNYKVNIFFLNIYFKCHIFLCNKYLYAIKSIVIYFQTKIYNSYG